MTKLVFRDVQREVQGFADAGNTIHFTKTSSIVSVAFGIVQQSTATDTSFLLDGRISGRQTGFSSEADATSVTIGESGSVAGYNGLRFDGHDAKVINNGSVIANNEGISLYAGGGSVLNQGTIVAGYGFYLNAGSASFVNGRHGRIEAFYEAMLSFSEAGEKVVFTNHGTVIASDSGIAVIGDAENNTVINDGTMIGDIDLGAGFNVVDLRRGRFVGEIFGGLGDDQLITDTASYHTIENAGAGFDSVISSVNYNLSDYVEQLTLSERKAISGTGNASDNKLFGNVADNSLKGLAGMDTLNGGAGDDVLFGGADDDTFVFGKNHGHDTVEDFVPGSDRLDLNDWIGTNDFDQIMSHVHDSDRGAVIRFDHESVTLVDVDKIDLSRDDFLLVA